MKRLKDNFKKNGLDYRLVKRTDKVAMYSQSYGNAVVSYEVFIIPVRNNEFGCRESIPSNGEFGIRYDSRSFGGKRKREQAETWYNHLVASIERQQFDSNSLNDVSIGLRGIHKLSTQP